MQNFFSASNFGVPFCCGVSRKGIHFVNTENGIAALVSLQREKVMLFFGRRWLDYAAATTTIFAAPANDLLVLLLRNTIKATVLSNSNFLF